MVAVDELDSLRGCLGACDTDCATNARDAETWAICTGDIGAPHISVSRMLMLAHRQAHRPPFRAQLCMHTHLLAVLFVAHEMYMM
eukprot:6405064-Amphidinium_carterae.1